VLIFVAVVDFVGFCVWRCCWYFSVNCVLGFGFAKGCQGFGFYFWTL